MTEVCNCGGGHRTRLTLLQDTANATLRSETFCRNCARCNNSKRGCKNCQKRCKTFAMAEPSNTVQILVACAMQGTRLVHLHCLRRGGTTETGSHINVCAIYGIRLTRTNRFRLGNTTETVQLNKMCVICGVQFTWMNYLR